MHIQTIRKHQREQGYEESVEIEAQTREEAIKIAQTTGKLDWNT